ncbi:chromate resistance protein ChrB domain-containing protein [Polaromonas eurypsychrophila]|uniref:Sulfurtransferase n=1 Tax=Polaromonas eurypsychrophila TaxID=1614635 RepID=A0A916S962_9BURK|nr:chromate resistance protein ChrB domain-containing protein [Polaromonas eurypsychrophila]GGA89761.1 sulfurtransferase [Polaromonas eurypsychrophila]
MDTSFPSVPRITAEELAARMGRADAPLLLDVRREGKFAESPLMLAGARRCAPEDMAALAATGPAREVVVYCVHGHNVSADAATLLRAAGWNARFLAGGFEGGEDGVDAAEDIVRWRLTPLPTMRKRADWGVTGEQVSRWITRERPKIDRIACPWLIRRFIDPRAEFFYVPTAQVFSEAARLKAVAYDLPGAPVTHEGEWCSFDGLLRAFEIEDPAVDRLARIVRGADTGRLALEPQCAGLLVFSLGLSRLHKDDHSMLEAAMPLYDALYAWCASEAHAVWQGKSPEWHDWRPETLAGAVA